MTRILVAQVEATKPSASGHWFGYEVFDIDGDFHLVIHTSTYTGVLRDSHWATPEQKLDALTKDGAITEATEKTVAYSNAVLGIPAPDINQEISDDTTGH